MSGAMNRSLYSRINYVHSPDGELRVSGTIETMATGFRRVHVLHYANAPVLTRKKTGRYDLAWKDCSVQRFSK